MPHTDIAAGTGIGCAGPGQQPCPPLADTRLRSHAYAASGARRDPDVGRGRITLVRGDLRAAADAIQLSRRTMWPIMGNLFLAFAYNLAALPLAVAGLLNPMIAGATMALGSAFVVANSLRLRGVDTAAPHLPDRWTLDAPAGPTGTPTEPGVPVPNGFGLATALGRRRRLAATYLDDGAIA